MPPEVIGYVLTSYPKVGSADVYACDPTHQLDLLLLSTGCHGVMSCTKGPWELK